MKYHTLKMEEVNDTMRHLWNKTYQGTDIDGIKIRSDVEGGVSKRSYNYRVRVHVMPSYLRLLRHDSGRHDKGQRRDGHERTVFRWSEDASLYYHPSRPRRLVRPKLWNPRIGRTD